jgi:predicted dehydrogenase
MATPLNVGLVGGGKGAFIVHAHEKAIHFDGTRRVVAGALYPEPNVALEEAAAWPYPIRGYGSYDEMIAANASLPADERLDYVLIVTPNHVHFDPAMKAMKAGIAVFCEKPLCLNLKEASVLVRTSRKLGIPFGVAHTYLGHWTTRFARYIVQRGLLGDVRWVDSSYLQGWLATKLEATGQQQATWRVDPKRAGGSGCGGDIGTHALMQLRYVTGLDVCGGPPARRSLHGVLHAVERREGPRPRVADLHRLQERPGHRRRGHEGHASLEAGGTRGGHDSPAEPAGSRLLARRGDAGRRLPAERRAGGVAGGANGSVGSPRGVPRRVRAAAPQLRA